MSEPNPELAAQFEKEDAERKAARANRDGPMGPAGMSWGDFRAELGTRQFVSFATTATRQGNRASDTRENSKYFKGSVSKCSSNYE